MKRIGFIIGSILIAFVAVGCKDSGKPIANASSSPPAVSTPAVSINSESSPTPTYSPPSVPNASGKWGTNAACDVSLSMNGPSYLIASVHLKNTGNVGMIAKVKVSWPQEGFNPITRTKTVKVAWHSSKDVNLRVPASMNASPDVIGNFQNVQLGSSKMDVCHYHVAITGNYGQVH